MMVDILMQILLIQHHINDIILLMVHYINFILLIGVYQVLIIVVILYSMFMVELQLQHIQVQLMIQQI